MTRTRPDDSEISNIYIDETSQNRHSYLILGGLILDKQCLARFDELISGARAPELPHGEMKWEKVSRSKLVAYKRVVDVFFDGDKACTPMEFHSIVVRTARLKDNLFNQGSREIGFNKEVYQLCMKFGRLYKRRLFHIYPDERSTTRPTEELRSILNFGMRKKGDSRGWPFRRLHFQDSKKIYALQLVDILIGAVAYRLNAHDRKEGASEAKIELSKYVLEKARIRDVTKDTAISGKFTIWHRQLR